MDVEGENDGAVMPVSDTCNGITHEYPLDTYTILYTCPTTLHTSPLGNDEHIPPLILNYCGKVIETYAKSVPVYAGTMVILNTVVYASIVLVNEYDCTTMVDSCEFTLMTVD